MEDEVLKAIESGKHKSLSDLAFHLEITIPELKGILDILVATKKLSTLFGIDPEIRKCSGCKNCKGCGLKHNKNS